METFIYYHILLMSNPFVVVGVIFILGMLVQALITSIFIRKRKYILLGEYNYSKLDITKLILMSVFMWPISIYYGIKSLYMYLRSNRIETEDEEERDEHGR